MIEIKQNWSILVSLYLALPDLIVVQLVVCQFQFLDAFSNFCKRYNHFEIITISLQIAILTQLNIKPQTLFKFKSC